MHLQAASPCLVKSGLEHVLRVALRAILCKTNIVKCGADEAHKIFASFLTQNSNMHGQHATFLILTVNMNIFLRERERFFKY
jgi:hypothetical protein